MQRTIQLKLLQQKGKIMRHTSPWFTAGYPHTVMFHFHEVHKTNARRGGCVRQAAGRVRI
jgi:hypothetical protein